MPENELLDALYDCFKKYRYWSMSALRTELYQPEQYLRQTLLKIAEQVKSGPFNNHWKLKETSNIDLNALKGESAPQREGAETDAISSAQGSDNDDDEDDEDDDDLQMEDVGI